MTEFTKANAAALGINCSGPGGVGGTLILETPVSINLALFSAACSIGFMSYIGSGSRVTATDIGRYCAIAPNVEIGPAEHPTDWFSVHPFQYDGTGQFRTAPEYEAIKGSNKFNGNDARTCIGNDVWIGDGVFIKKGVTIGDGAIVAARSVVAKDVAPYSIVAGVPAKVVRMRYPLDISERFLRLRWWNFDISQAKSELNFADAIGCLSALEIALKSGRLSELNPTQYKILGGAKPRIVAHPPA